MYYGSTESLIIPRFASWEELGWVLVCTGFALGRGKDRRKEWLYSMYSFSKAMISAEYERIVE